MEHVFRSHVVRTIRFNGKSIQQEAREGVVTYLVLVWGDDGGWSDLGCFASEPTLALDTLLSSVWSSFLILVLVLQILAPQKIFHFSVLFRKLYCVC